MQYPSGPRQPEPPLQPQPLHWQASAAITEEGAGNIRNPNEISTNPLAITLRMGSSRSLRASNVHVLFSSGKGVDEKSSCPLDEAVHDLLLTGLVEIDRELVAVDLRHAAIAEFLVEHAHADA